MKIKGIKCECDSEEFYGESVGNNYGIYCKECGRWQKWANKNERRLLQRGEQIGQK